MDRSRPGRRASALPGARRAPSDARRRRTPRHEPRRCPRWPSATSCRHYTRLSQQNYGVDTGFYPLGSCSMKYNPKVAETVAALPGFQRLHPLQPDDTRAGHARAPVAAGAGALRDHRDGARHAPAARGRVRGADRPADHAGVPHEAAATRGGRSLIPDSAHGTNPASVRLAGYEAVHVPSDARGLVDVGALEKLVDEDVAGLMLTNPNTLGLFEEDIERDRRRRPRASAGSSTTTARTSTRSWAGCRPGDMGFDIVHINTHKTFATPHGGGGPGAGPVGGGRAARAVPPGPDRGARRGRVASGSRTTGRTRSGGCTGSTGTSACSSARTLYVFLHGGDGLRGGERARGAQRELPRRRSCEDAFPLAYPDGAPDARVRRHGQAAPRRARASGRWTWPSG